MHKLKLFALVCFLCFHANTHTYDTGNDLYQAMEKKEEAVNVLLYTKGVLTGSLWAYEIGKTGSVMSMKTSDVQRGIGICTSTGVNLGQIVDVVRKFLRETPENRHLEASFLILLAARKAFPCN